MGMFDTVQVQNISNDKFNHNGHSFQTKDLDNQLSEYLVFNNQVWMEYDGENSERLELAKVIEFNDVLNIYTTVTSSGVERWIEYDLTFKNGLLVDVALLSDRITKDHRDLSARRPECPSNRMLLTIDISNLDDELKEKALDEIEGKLDLLREVLGNPKASISYPVRSGASIRHLFSVVQDMSDFKRSVDNKKPISTPNGDKINIFFDEASHYSK